MSAALLDVNVLVALFDPDHPHHEVAHDWFADHHADGWATCPLTENGFIRVLSNPRYGSPYAQTPALIDALRKFCASGHHTFWPDAVSLRDDTSFNLSLVRGHRQLTDVYLLALAVKHRGRFVTFDQSIPAGAIKGLKRDVLQVLAISE